MNSLTFFKFNHYNHLLPLLSPTSKPQRPPTSAPFSAQPSHSPNSGIPTDDIKTLATFRSLHNDIRVLQISRKADHPFAGSRLLLLDSAGNIHSVSFLLTPFTSTYLDIFSLLPPLLPNTNAAPVALLGLGAASAARLLLHLYPDNLTLHAFELDPSVLSVARQYFGLSKLQLQYRHRLFVHVGDALQPHVLDAASADGYAGIMVDLFSKGRLLPELQRRETWEMVRGRLRRGGRVMVNCGGSCVESEEDGGGRDGRDAMEETLRVMGKVFGGDEVWVLDLGGRREGESCMAMTGPRPDFERWRRVLDERLRGYVGMWEPYRHSSWRC